MRNRDLPQGRDARSPTRRSRSPVRKSPSPTRRSPTEQKKTTTIIVDGVSEDTKQRDLLQEFERYGPVLEIFGDSEEGYFIEYEYRSDAERAVQAKDGTRFDGKVLSVEIRDYAPRSLGRKHLFIVASTFDEGFESADALFWADNVEQVAQYMLDSVRRYIDRGKTGMNKFYAALSSSDWTIVYGRDNDDEPYDDDQKIRTLRFDSMLGLISLKDFINWIDSTEVDGDSFNKISISEYDPSSIKTL